MVDMQQKHDHSMQMLKEEISDLKKEIKQLSEYKKSEQDKEDQMSVAEPFQKLIEQRKTI